jgi:hypothetical protein
MQKPLFALSLGIAATLLVPSQLKAQAAQCAPRQLIVEKLQSKYGETRQSIGLGQQNSVVEMFASPETGSWTILFTRPDGTACLVASGEHYEAVAEDLPDTGEQA